MIPATLRFPIARIARTPRGWLPIGAWALIAFGAAYAERTRGSDHAAAHALLGTFGGIALPLLSYAVVGAALGGDGLARSGRALVAFGATSTRVALSTIAAAAGVSAILSALFAAVVAALAHGPSDPPLAADIATSAWVSALGAAAYASYFAFGASLGKRGLGRSILLAVDWLFGLGTGFAAMFTPRAHVRSLLGGEDVMDLSGRWSAAILIALTVTFGALAIWRTSRAAR